jgi:hypothetical protein
MARFAQAVLRGEVQDALSPLGERRPLFVTGNIPNHGVLGRRGASGYLRRVAQELARRNLDAASVERAATCMQRSSELFQTLRYETELPAAGELVRCIAQLELAALAAMREAWGEVRRLGAREPALA